MTPRDQNKNKAGMKEEEAKVKRGNERGRKHKPTAYNVDNRIQEDIKNQMKSSAVNWLKMFLLNWSHNMQLTIKRQYIIVAFLFCSKYCDQSSN